MTVACSRTIPSPSGSMRTWSVRPAGSFVATVATAASPSRRTSVARVAWNQVPPARKPSAPAGLGPVARLSSSAAAPPRKEMCHGSGCRFACAAPEATVSSAAAGAAVSASPMTVSRKWRAVRRVIGGSAGQATRGHLSALPVFAWVAAAGADGPVKTFARGGGLRAGVAPFSPRMPADPARPASGARPARGALGLLHADDAPLERVRRIFLALALAACSLAAVAVGAIPDRTPGLRLAGLAAVAALAAVWLRAHRHGALSPWDEPIELLALFAVGLAAGPDAAMAVVCAGLYLRVLYGSRRRAVAGLAVYSVAYLASVIVAG